ncbi:MAG: hypothetical protein JWQ87_5452 [Candidatus Sulfotelmatobacter sp.]|nr:hypothetical protein [Candidatus Sulfotelmatobacter sp.]
MPSALQQAGAQLDRPSKNGCLHINRFFSGLWSNRSPLREAGVPYTYEKFYSGARFDSVLDGQNTELTTRLTWARRPGHSVYNSQTFSAVNTFYAFRVTNQTTGVPSIRVIADTPTAVYDATGPNTKTLLFNKSANAGQTSFQGVGNTLYMGDGAETKKWIYLFPWQANATYSTGNAIVDANGNIQVVTSTSIPVTGTGSGVQVLSNVVFVGFSGPVKWTTAQLQSLPGSPATFSGFVGAAFLNSLMLTIVSAVNVNFPVAGHPSHWITFSYTHADYPYTADGAGLVLLTSGSGVSSGSAPSWNTNLGGTTSDGTAIWTNKGSQVQDWGTFGPQGAPIVSNVLSIAGSAWAASTYYWPQNNAIILDSNGNIQQLTTDGTTGTVPVWSSTPGVTTTDGSAVWTCGGSGTRATTHAYAVGAWIAVTSVQTFQEPSGYDPYSHQFTYQTITLTSLYFFVCTVAGTTSSIATGNISWPSGGSVFDGSVTWANAGYQVKRANASATSPTSAVAGNVANSLLVTQVGSIVDNAGSGGGAGFTQNVTIPGKSGAAAPTWKISGGVEQTGLVTAETGGLQWANAGPVGAANTGTWVYAASFGNSVTGDESTASSLSTPITLAAQSVISVSGNGDPNWQTDGTDTIYIYRSVQGTSVPFRLAQIPAPLNGAPWSYLDASPDPPNPGSTLNQFISPDLTGINAPPPSNLIGLSYHLSRVWGISNEFVRYSQVGGAGVGVGADNWAAGNYFQMPSTPIVLWPSAAGIFFWTNSNIWLSSGLDGNGNPLKPTLFLDQTGLLSPNAFTVNGSIPAIFASDSTAQVLDPSAGVQFIGLPIADLLAKFNPASAYVTWHSYGTDQGYYVADGSTGWYRLTPLSPPESGFAWSTKANIVGGCKCVKSIETSPGIRSLLIGPAISGPILKRDLTTHADNGTSYLANLVIGSIVLAQPNQCAEVVSITTECVATGSRPTIGILGDEISGAFENLVQGVPDPPFLYPSQSLYADRWYFNQLQQPAWMRHLQINIQWEAENAANELLTYSLFGSLHTEG